MPTVEVKLTSVSKLKTSTKYDEDNHELVTTVQAEVGVHPVVLARILNLQKQGAPLYMIIGSQQAVMDLELKTIDLKTKPPEKAAKETAVVTKEKVPALV